MQLKDFLKKHVDTINETLLDEALFGKELVVVKFLTAAYAFNTHVLKVKNNRPLKQN